MYLMQNKQFKLENIKYFPIRYLDFPLDFSISYVALLFFDAFPHIRLFGTQEYVEKFRNKIRSGMSSEMIECTIDYEHELVYIHEPLDSFGREKTSKTKRLIELDASIELCHRGFIGYTCITQENFYHLLLTWQKLIDKRSLYILIYLDDENWYDVLPFETQEAMEKFIVDHTQQEIAENK